MMVDMMIDIGPRLNSAIPTLLPITLRSKLWTWNFYVKALNSSYFLDHIMDLAYI